MKSSSIFFLNTIFVSSHMYPENPEGTQVIFSDVLEVGLFHITV